MVVGIDQSPGGFVGRASNRKRTRRESVQRARVSRRAVTEIQFQSRRQPALSARAHALREAFQADAERYEQASRVWCGSEPVPAEVPRWAAGPFGRRIPSWSALGVARYAPCLLTAQLCDPGLIIADPAYWNVATKALVRAVAFDGLEPGHPALNAVLALLAPVATTELGYGQALREWLRDGRPAGRREPEFPVLDGPVLLLGIGALVHLTQALAGAIPGEPELAVLSRALDGTIPGAAGSVVAEALTEALNPRYLRGLPDELRQPLGRPPYANPLETLVTAGVVAPRNVLPAGLAILRALINLCQNEATPISHKAA